MEGDLRFMFENFEYSCPVRGPSLCNYSLILLSLLDNTK